MVEIFPALHKWLQHARKKSKRVHVLERLLVPSPDLSPPPGIEYSWWNDPVLKITNEMLQTLENAAPDGLGHKRDEFDEATEWPRWHQFRSEVVIASRLARAGIIFSLPKKGPDLVLAGPSGLKVGIQQDCKKKQLDDERHIAQASEMPTFLVIDITHCAGITPEILPK